MALTIIRPFDIVSSFYEIITVPFYQIAVELGKEESVGRAAFHVVLICPNRLPLTVMGEFLNIRAFSLSIQSHETDHLCARLVQTI